MDDNLFADLPFNLAGESQSSELTAEAEARVRALAESEARKAQLTFKYACGCIEKVRADTFPEPKQNETYIDYDCANCHY